MEKMQMSILINSMEMPTDGNETIIRIQSDGTVLDQYGHHLAITAIPVPPHGDLIDRNALKRHTATEWFCGRKRVNVPWKAVADAPTIIPADPAEGGNQ